MLLTKTEFQKEIDRFKTFMRIAMAIHTLALALAFAVLLAVLG